MAPEVFVFDMKVCNSNGRKSLSTHGIIIALGRYLTFMLSVTGICSRVHLRYISSPDSPYIPFPPHEIEEELIY